MDKYLKKFASLYANDANIYTLLSLVSCNKI